MISKKRIEREVEEHAKNTMIKKQLRGLCPSDAANCSPSSDTSETQTKVTRICGNWNNAGDRVQEFVLADFARQLERERNEARAMARDMRNQFEKASTARLLFPWENAKVSARPGEDGETEKGELEP